MAQITNPGPRGGPQAAVFDLGLIVDRILTHTVRPRLEPAQFRAAVKRLGFASIEEFGERLGLPPATIRSWNRFGLSADAAQLLLALARYRTRLAAAIEDIEATTHVGLADFFEEHRLP